MGRIALVLVVGIPLAWHLGLAAYVTWDAGRTRMGRAKWGTIALLVPLFGFLAYVFERSERDYDPATDPYAGGGWNLRADQSDGEKEGAEEGAGGGEDAVGDGDGPAGP